MDGSEVFAEFLDLLLADVATLRGDTDVAAQTLAADPDASDTASDTATDPAALADQPPPDSFTTAPQHPIGLGTVTDTATPPGPRTRRTVTEVDTVLDWIVVTRGTSFLREEPARRLLFDPASRPAIRDRVLAIIRTEDVLSDQLAQRAPEHAASRELLAMLMTLLHVRELAEVLEHLDRLLERYVAAVALDTVITSFRLRRAREAMRLRVREVRRGRNALSTVVRNMCQATRHTGWTHQLFVERQLDRLLATRFQWQLQQRVAAVAHSSPPSPADLANIERRSEIAELLDRLIPDIQLLERRRTALRALLPRDSGATREEREAARRELNVVWPLLRSKRAERQELRAEERRLHRELRGEAYQRVQAYLEAERREIRREDATRERDQLLARADRLLAGAVAERLDTGTEEERWQRYQLLLERLLGNQRNLGLELFLDSFLKVAQYTERTRNIGVAVHQRGHVQWLTYPGHGDGAVDLNCAAQREVTVARPTELSLPERLRSEPADWTAYRLTASEVTNRVHGTTDLQDIFGHIAGALVRSRSGRGASSDDMANTLSRNEGSDLAPPEVVGRRLTYREVTSILIGLLAENLTSIPNATAFNALRDEVVDDLERAVVRSSRLPRGTEVFRRGVPVTGRGSLGRFIEHLTQREVVEAVTEVLSMTSTQHYEQERRHLIHQIWRLVMWMRSAGAEAHRRAGSVTIQHRYQSAGGTDLLIEIFYTHLHHVDVRAGARLRDGQQLGLSGMTGNAVNPHVHLEIRVKRSGTTLGVLLPHEFFPLTDQ